MRVHGGSLRDGHVVPRLNTMYSMPNNISCMSLVRGVNPTTLNFKRSLNISVHP